MQPWVQGNFVPLNQMKMSNKKVWFVTGASKGLGLSLVKKLLQEGYRVAATSRNVAELTEAVGETSTSFLPLVVDLPNEKNVHDAIAKTAEKFGSIDVVVNNAGYGLIGGLEELGDAEARANFEVNVFGSLNVIRQALPLLRGQGSGHIMNVSSIGGFTGMFPGFGIYCATKFAVQGFTESLAEEVKALGIKATIVSPGYFRTSFLTQDSLRTPAHPIEAYEAVRQSMSFHQNDMDGNQPGDPDKAADVMIKAAESENPPLHLFLGQDAYDIAYQKIEAVKGDLEAWKALTTSTGF